VVHGTRAWKINFGGQKVKGQGHRRPKFDLEAMAEPSFLTPFGVENDLLAIVSMKSSKKVWLGLQTAKNILTGGTSLPIP